MDISFVCRVIFLVVIIPAIAAFLTWHGVKTRNTRYHEEYDKGYQQGYVDACKDFYKGKLKYDLVENEDGTREWKKIELNNKGKNEKIIYQHGNFKHGVMVK